MTTVRRETSPIGCAPPALDLYAKCPWVGHMPERPLCGLCWWKQNWVHENDEGTGYAEAWIVESHHMDCPRAEHDGERHLILSRAPGTAIAP